MRRRRGAVERQRHRAVWRECTIKADEMTDDLRETWFAGLASVWQSAPCSTTTIRSFMWERRAWHPIPALLPEWGTSRFTGFRVREDVEANNTTELAVVGESVNESGRRECRAPAGGRAGAWTLAVPGGAAVSGRLPLGTLSPGYDKSPMHLPLRWIRTG